MQIVVEKENIFLPSPAKLIKKTQLTKSEILFEFQFEDKDLQKYFTYEPGQFVLVSIMGIGEAPFSFASTPTRKGSIELGIRKYEGGDITTAMHNLNVGDVVGIRGPYGNSFPMEKLKGKNLLFVGGGIGQIPLRGVINYVMDNREDYGKLTIFYGATCPEDRVFVDELENVWPKYDNVEMFQTVDTCDDSWQGTVGVVTCLFGLCQVDPENTVALVCGPPVMYKFVVKELLGVGFKKDEILMTMERKMKCGVGKCAHCQIGHKLTCMDGPVFTYFEIQRLQEAI
jgi:NAD(P)H-flavin reductase